MYKLADRFVPPGALAIHWFEQSSFAVKNASGVVVLVDPYFPAERTPDRFVHLERPVDPAILRPDVVLLTHDHSDHTHPETITAIAANSPRTVFVGPPESVTRIVEECGVPSERARTVSVGESARLGPIVVFPVYSKPPEGDPSAGIAAPDTTHLGYVVETGGRRLYFSGDPINTLADHPEITDRIRRLVPEIGFLTTHPAEGEFPFFDGARRLAEAVGLARAVPSHYECFVKRDYDPAAFVDAFAGSSVEVTVIPWNETVDV